MTYSSRVLRFALISLSFAGGCSRGPKPPIDLHPPASRETIRNLPSWYLKPPTDNNYLFGTATALSRDVQVAINKAQADARNALAQELEVKYGALNKRFVEEVGREGSQLLDQYTAVYKGVVSTTLYGSRPRQQVLRTEGSLYRAIILMELPVGEMSRRLLEQLRAQEQLYTRFRAGEAFKELDAEVQRYEAWKRQQGIPR
ncbi:MAG: LPP20 family lipoprotein [Gemmatimonadaceae bacterium]